MKKRELADLTCSLAGALAEVGDAWSLLILKEVMLRNRRFNGIAAQTGISESSLALRLKRLETGGILKRHAYQERPTRYEYRITEKGVDLWPALVAFTSWGDRWLGRKTPPLTYVCSACGDHARAHLACTGCGAELDAKGVTAVQSRAMAKDRASRRL